MIRLLSMLLLLLAAPAVRAAEPMAGYLMGYFTETPKGSGNSWTLHLATSEDGLDWMPLNQNEPVLVPALGQKGLHDPYFLRKQDGGFVVLATNLTGTTIISRPEIHVWDTDDFITFRNARLVKLHDTPMHTLAPEAFFDPDRNQYGVIWSGDTDYNRIYVNYTTDFTNFGPHEVYFDPGYDVLDATLCPEPVQGGRFLYFKDAVTRRLRGARSQTPAPHGFDRDIYTKPIGKNDGQAPLLVKAPQENRWYLYSESEAWRTDDITRDTWRQIGRRGFSPPLNSKHATIIPITRTEMDRLIGHWEKPRWSRLKSYNFPDHVVRHENLYCRISYVSTDPYQDSLWRIVPGLADPGGVSFEAVNFPGHYLRTVAEHVMLSKNDDSPAFRTKATFLKVPGLADGSWSSFRSLTSPELYLRHANYFLRLEPVKTAIDKEDATFRIVY